MQISALKVSANEVFPDQDKATVNSLIVTQPGWIASPHQFTLQYFLTPARARTQIHPKLNVITTRPPRLTQVTVLLQ